MNKKILTGLIILFLCSTILVFAEKKPFVPVFQFPVKCSLNNDCWISEYPDIDPSPDWHDYTGGKRSTNGHSGTDIIIPNLEEMHKGIPVLAAAEGTVIAVRDGVNDINVKEIGEATVDKIGCGNAAVISPGDGWITMYCHMRKGSVTVKKGDLVSAGQRLGYVGMSGLAETPHLHFEVRHLKKPVDPFTGNSLNTGEIINHPLWKDIKSIKYIPTFIYNIGVTDKEPDIMHIQSGDININEISIKHPAIILWADIFGLDKDDYIRFKINGPKTKTLVDKKYTLEKSNVRRFFTLKHNSADLKPGLYQAIVTIHKYTTSFEYNKKITFKVT